MNLDLSEKIAKGTSDLYLEIQRILPQHPELGEALRIASDEMERLVQYARSALRAMDRYERYVEMLRCGILDNLPHPALLEIITKLYTVNPKDKKDENTRSHPPAGDDRQNDPGAHRDPRR